MSDQQNLHTLADAAQLTGLSVEALRLRIKRGNLASEKGNDGHPRVRLTSADLEGFQRFARRRSTLNRRDPTETNENRALEQAVGVLQEQLERERDRADRAEARAEVAEQGQAAARSEAAQLREERDAARVRAAQAEGDTKAAEARAEGLREALAEARRPFWRRWLGAAALCAASGLWPAMAPAQVEQDSATWMLRGCRVLIYKAETNAMTRDESFLAGLCSGVVRTLLSVDVIETCAPNRSTQGQAVRVVVRYIEGRPERQHESFVQLGLEALRSAWPCRR